MNFTKLLENLYAGLSEEADDKQEGIAIDASQAEKLSNVLALLGVDPDTVIRTESEEENPDDGLSSFAESPKVIDTPEPTPVDAKDTQGKAKARAVKAAPTSAEIEKAIPEPKNVKDKPKRNPFKVEISQETIAAAQKFFEIGKIGENWYYDANKTIEQGFDNEQDRILFALLLAATSVQNEIYVNFIEAAALFNAIKKDLRENLDLLKQFGDDKSVSVTDNALLTHPTYGKLNMFSSALKVKITSISAKFGNIKRIIPLLINGTLSKEIVRNAIANSVDLTGKKSFDSRDPLIRRLKIANYALTLIDPTFASTDKNWFNVVVDTWMFRIFYPEHAKDKGIITKLFTNQRAYANVSRVVSDMAAQAGVSPHVMQAALWTGIKKTWEGDSADVSNYVSAIQRMVSEYGQFWADMQIETQKLGEIISRLDTETASSIVASKRADVGRALGMKTRERAAAAKAAKAAQQEE